jgi:NAD(P)-dependent dehydrogenase (short-subunit alcohol dehydrogenase family)
MSFENKKILVTGGTSGIGQKIVELLLNKGAFVYINYKGNEDNKEITSNLFKNFEGKYRFIKADVSDEKQVKQMFDKILALDGLVNNAGTNVDEFIENAKLDTYMSVINTNYIGKMLCIKYAVQLLKESQNASIVNISSSLGVKADTECSAYCCAAAAIIKLTECAALELSKYNIRVNTVSPSFTPTPLSLAGWTKEEIKLKEENNPRHRLGKLEDMANAVLFLLSDESDYINGENLKVNGGSLLK